MSRDTNKSVMFNMNILKIMLKNKEKNSVVRGIFLIGGWGLGLDRFYEGDKKGGVLSIIGWSITFFTFLYLKCSGYEYVDGEKLFRLLPKSFNCFTFASWSLWRVSYN